MSRIKKETKSSNEANYTLYNQKLTFDFLKGHLWKAADILRGSLDPSEYRQPVMTELFLKRLNDNFEEQAEKLISKGKRQKVAYENKNRHYFFIPKDGRWSVLAGINDWGGVSPLTFDHINPSISSVRDMTETKGYSLRARLPAYPEFLSNTAFISDKLRLYIEPLFEGYGLVPEGYLL